MANRGQRLTDPEGQQLLIEDGFDPEKAKHTTCFYLRDSGCLCFHLAYEYDRERQQRLRDQRRGAEHAEVLQRLSGRTSP